MVGGEDFTLSPVSSPGQALALSPYRVQGSEGEGIMQRSAKAGIQRMGRSFDKLRTNEMSVYLPLGTEGEGTLHDQ